MVEAVRLVIWDLDETFWSGTVTEGGIAYSEANHALVVTLAERGIMSSICSKNDHAAIEAILAERGLWEYFIFPSIDWSSKGPRLAALVEAVQLRPETVLFIDDNPMNLAEAQHFVPGLQVAGPEIIAGMLASPLFKGKNDKALTRLAQYKVLERKQVDARAATDNRAFLRGSDIRVRIEPDIAANIDRAIELINRTNQLNFTKLRLPEDADAARAELLALVSHYSVQAGLIHVSDRYGDYGYVGIYVMRSTMENRGLLHYAFSCRTLGMLIETWVYRHLQRPVLTVAGEVLTDVQDDSVEIDWVSLASGPDAARGTERPRFRRLVLRGGCDMAALAHYLSPLADETVSETFLARDSRHIRLDHSAFLGLALRGATAAQQAALRAMHYLPEDYHSVIAHPTGGPEVWCLSFWMDGPLRVYDAAGVRVPFPRAQDGSDDAMLRALGDVSPASEQEFKAVLHDLLAHAGPDIAIVVFLTPEQGVDRATGQRIRLPHEERVNRWTREVLEGRPGCHLVDPLAHVQAASEMPETKHFDRIVYYRIAEAAIAMLQREPALAD